MRREADTRRSAIRVVVGDRCEGHEFMILIGNTNGMPGAGFVSRGGIPDTRNVEAGAGVAGAATTHTAVGDEIEGISTVSAGAPRGWPRWAQRDTWLDGVEALLTRPCEAFAQ